VKYRPGKTNVVADALSRQTHLTNMTILSTKLANISFLQQEYQKDNYFSPIWNVLNNQETCNPKQQTYIKYFELKDGKIYLKEGQRLAVPANKQIRSQLLQEHHDAKIAGHVGIDKTYAAISRNYYWPKLSKDVRKYVLSCDQCQRNKSSNQQPAGLLQPLDTPNNRW